MSSQIILASASPRRKELLAQIGYDFKVVVSDVDENIEKCEPSQFVAKLSKRKAMAVADEILADKVTAGEKSASCIMEMSSDKTIVIGADTVVAIDGEILGKPVDEEDAVRMLLMLGGKCHSVYTGVTIVKKGVVGGDSGDSAESVDSVETAETVDSVDSVETFYDETRVYMYPITEQEARDYVATGEPMDKAGAYAIQGIAGKFVERIEGSYNNVVGLPVEKIYQRLK